MCFNMRKPKEVSNRQCVGAAATLNNMLVKLPPTFNEGQKPPDSDMASEAPKTQKILMTDHGFDLQTTTADEFVEICERTETKDSIQLKRSSKHSSGHNSNNNEPHTKKTKKKGKTAQVIRQEFCCKEHGLNSTHDSKDCKVLNGAKKEANKKRDNSKNKHLDCKSKSKCKKELNLLQMETKREKAKGTKACKRLKSDQANSDSDASSHSSGSSSSSFDSDSEWETGCKSENHTSENKTKIKIAVQQEMQKRSLTAITQMTLSMTPTFCPTCASPRTGGHHHHGKHSSARMWMT
jgi:hypothetical protein